MKKSFDDIKKNLSKKELKFKEFLNGGRDVIPIVIGAIPPGLLFGAICAKQNFSLINSMVMSLIINAGTAQFVGLGMIIAGVAWPFIITTTLIINLRHIFYSLALADYVKPLPLKWRALLAFGMTDAIYLLAFKRYSSADNVPFKHWYFFGSSVVLYFFWVSSTFLGFEFGALLQNLNNLGLDFAIYATYIAMLVPSLNGFKAFFVAILSGLLSLALFTLPYQIGLFLATLLSISFGVILDKKFGVAE